jgi:hypothetical protein
MRIAVAIGKAVVVDVVTRPPDRPLLHGGRGDHGPEKPRRTVHLEGPVREIAVERERQANGAQEVRRCPQRDEPPRERYEENEKSG